MNVSNDSNSNLTVYQSISSAESFIIIDEANKSDDACGTGDINLNSPHFKLTNGNFSNNRWSDISKHV